MSEGVLLIGTEMLYADDSYTLAYSSLIGLVVILLVDFLRNFVCQQPIKMTKIKMEQQPNQFLPLNTVQSKEHSQVHPLDLLLYDSLQLMFPHEDYVYDRPIPGSGTDDASDLGYRIYLFQELKLNRRFQTNNPLDSVNDNTKAFVNESPNLAQHISKQEMDFPTIIQSKQRNPKIVTFSTLGQPKSFTEHFTKIISLTKEKERLRQIRLQQLRMKSMKSIQEQEELQEELIRLEQLKKQKLKQKFRQQNTIRQAIKMQRKKRQNRFSEFFREYQRKKPLYQIKQQQFILGQLREQQQKRESVLRKLEDELRPIDLKELREHEQNYQRIKRQLKEEKKRQRMHSVGSQNPHQYYRGRSYDRVQRQTEEQMKSKSRQNSSFEKRKIYERLVLKDIKKPVQLIIPKSKQSQQQQDLQLIRIQRRKALGNEYLKYSKQKHVTQGEIHIAAIPDPGILAKRIKYNIKKRLMMNRANTKNNLEDLIYKNSVRDQVIKMKEDFQQDVQQQRYIQSIKQKLMILQSINNQL